MQFSILTVFTLVAVALATPHKMVRRQDSTVAVNTPAMTDEQGNVVPFDSKGVFQAAKISGQ